MPTAGQVSSALGSSISIGTTATDPTADTYALLGETVTVPQFGLAYDSFGFTALADGFERIFKSTGKGGTIQVGLGRKPSDTGQAAARTALASHLTYNFKVILNDSSEATGSHGTTLYFKALVLSYQTGPLQIGSVVMATIGLGIDASSFSEVAAT